MVSFIGKRFSGSSIILICESFLQKMTIKLLVKCDLVHGFLRCGIPADTIDLDLKICMLKGIYTIQERLQGTNPLMQSMGS